MQADYAQREDSGSAQAADGLNRAGQKRVRASAAYAASRQDVRLERRRAGGETTANRRSKVVHIEQLVRVVIDHQDGRSERVERSGLVAGASRQRVRGHTDDAGGPYARDGLD